MEYAAQANALIWRNLEKDERVLRSGEYDRSSTVDWEGKVTCKQAVRKDETHSNCSFIENLARCDNLVDARKWNYRNKNVRKE